MTDNEICRAIAQSLGAIEGPREVHGNFSNAVKGSVTETTFPNYFTDPAARDLLVRRMLAVGWKIKLAQADDGSMFYLWLTEVEDKRIHVSDESYGRIWPLAYLKTLPAGKEPKGGA